MHSPTLFITENPTITDSMFDHIIPSIADYYNDDIKTNSIQAKELGLPWPMFLLNDNYNTVLSFAELHYKANLDEAYRLHKENPDSWYYAIERWQQKEKEFTPKTMVYNLDTYMAYDVPNIDNFSHIEYNCFILDLHY